jgi:tRNA modification GTPase
MSHAETSVSVLTPPGSAAVATLAVVGPRALDVVRELFRPAARPLPDPPPLDHFWYGHFGEPPGDAVIVAVRRLGPEPWVEVHCHGGTEVVRWLTRSLATLGVTVWSWTGFDVRGGASPLRAAAAVELARTPTRRTAAILLDQWQGALESSLAAIEQALAAGDAQRAGSIVSDLLRLAPLGRHLTRPWRVAVVGAPNVGKSSLVNALAGYQRSVVTAIPGTTRDIVSTALAIDGWPVELLDTAGLHPTANALEREGIARARATVSSADLCLWVVDVTTPPVSPDVDLPNVQHVLNKTDQLPAWDTAAVADAIPVSVHTGAGLDNLCERISRRLVPDPPPPGAGVPFTPRMIERLDAIAHALANGSVPAVRHHLASLREERSGTA